jgi:sulfur relay (sulfurtransferase) complex TusBCD TusD component (DsrE family)
MGKGPEELQLMLIGKYLQLLGQGEDIPAVICFYTEGVKMVVESSLVLEHLLVLEKRGARLIVCSTCITYYGLADKVRIGIIGGMTDILEAQLRAGKVITL